MDHAEKQELMKALGKTIIDTIKMELEPIRQEVMRLTLELKQAELTVASFRYCGVWSERANYKKNNFVTHHGSLWVANLDDISTMPGSGDSGWQMCVKRGENATKVHA